MDKDTFTGGVVPGGLTDHTEIKILLCHILSETGPLSRDDLLETLSAHGFANYFECADAISAITAAGHIDQQDGLCAVTDSGRKIAQALAKDVPLTVRERALQAARSAARRARNRASHIVRVSETETGFRVRCAVCEASGAEIFVLELEARTRTQAQRIRDKFVDDAEDLMRYCITRLVGPEL